MRCQNCKENPATLQLNLQVGHQVHQLHLCSDCWAQMATGRKQPSGFASMSGLPPFEQWMQMPKEQASPHSGAQHSDLLEQIGRNLSHSAEAGLIDPVIGRDEEIDRVIEILNRRNKNNPVLIGEPGVGKTAIAEGLALKISEGNVPSKLLGKEIYLLDVASLVADTGIRGQFEEKMKQLIAELQNRTNVILFIDELHLLVGAGSAQGSMDAGNILKPVLARGELQVIGATTLKEYRLIEKDAALERRFQPIMVDEPTVEAAIAILEGIRANYENYHQVHYSDEAIRACVVLSHRYIQDRFLPDKAIDLLDEAGSKINLAQTSQESSNVQAKLELIRAQKEKATEAENYERAAELRDEEHRLQQMIGAPVGAQQTLVTVDDIRLIIEQKTGIPVRKLQQDEQSKMKNLAEHLSEKIIGQSEAVNKVAKAIRRSRAGLKAKNRPIGSFLFVGPTGVGKTELSKCLAEVLFGDRESLIRLDMSEYMEKHSVSKLIGSPPGYVGHEEAGQLTEKVRRNPYSILLLDEIEKAHPDVQHLFLQILEDGRLTDSQGRTVSFKDTVIIMTSNAGTMHKEIKVGFNHPEHNSSVDSGLLSALGAYFKPEFLNRIDSIIAFQSLTESHLLQIVSISLEELQNNLKEQDIELFVTEEAKRKLAQLGYHPQFGARPLRRVVQEQVEDRIADFLLEEDAVQQLQIGVENDQIVVVQKSN
ncbi:MAG: ATP-dependent Clp protease ATP-binding subunit [Bacilli bacterium]|nr:ATP-dependent Clp protease ATP-binding subunit [Bacilli bacterium]